MDMAQQRLKRPPGAGLFSSILGVPKSVSGTQIIQHHPKPAVGNCTNGEHKADLRRLNQSTKVDFAHFVAATSSRLLQPIRNRLIIFRTEQPWSSLPNTSKRA